ncbi:MAG: hypothetical protein Kapaf2KO_12670 [Candidatus Kapaibacteriales bacterium]
MAQDVSKEIISKSLKRYFRRVWLYLLGIWFFILGAMSVTFIGLESFEYRLLLIFPTVLLMLSAFYVADVAQKTIERIKEEKKEEENLKIGLKVSSFKEYGKDQIN